METIKIEDIQEAMEDSIRISKYFDITIVSLFLMTILLCITKIDTFSASILFLLLGSINIILVLVFLYYGYQSFSTVINLELSIILVALQLVPLGVIFANYLKYQTIDGLIFVFLALIAVRRFLLSLFFKKRST